MKWIIVLILVFLFPTLPANACTPCSEEWTIIETAEKADLIIVGQKIKNGPMYKVGGFDEEIGPDWIEIEILEILKGYTDRKKIKVDSWSGMCGYGVLIEDEKKYAIFLSEEEGQYDSINSGCSVTKLLVESDSDIDELVAMLGSGISRTKVDGEADKNIGIIYIPILIIALFVGIILVLKLRKSDKA